MKPFDSSLFFNDPYFAESVQVAGVKTPAIIEDQTLLDSQGNIIQRVGDHLRITLQQTLALKAEITARGAVYIVEEVTPSGDTATHICIKQNTQRRK